MVFPLMPFTPPMGDGVPRWKTVDVRTLNTVPPGVLPGDLILYAGTYRFERTGSHPPIPDTPAGYTHLSGVSLASTDSSGAETLYGRSSARLVYKLADGSESGQVFSGYSGGVCAILRCIGAAAAAPSLRSNTADGTLNTTTFLGNEPDGIFPVIVPLVINSTNTGGDTGTFTMDGLSTRKWAFETVGGAAIILPQEDHTFSAPKNIVMAGSSTGDAFRMAILNLRYQ